MKLLFCTNLNEPDTVVRAVERMGARLEAEVLVLHVASAAQDAAAALDPAGSAMEDPVTGLGGHTPYAFYEADLQAERAAAEAEAFHEFVTGRFSGKIRAALKHGDPAATILEDADEHDVDLIAMGKHHRGALERLLMGSTPEHVLRESTRPVLLFPILRDDDHAS